MKSIKIILLIAVSPILFFIILAILLIDWFDIK